MFKPRLQIIKKDGQIQGCPWAWKTCWSVKPSMDHKRQTCGMEPEVSQLSPWKAMTANGYKQCRILFSPVSSNCLLQRWKFFLCKILQITIPANNKALIRPWVSMFDRLSLYFAVTNADRSFLVLQMPHERYFLCKLFCWGWILSFNYSPVRPFTCWKRLASCPPHCRID